MSNNMDMRISGSGTVPAGEYNHVSVSGSGRLVGRCAANLLLPRGQATAIASNV